MQALKKYVVRYRVPLILLLVLILAFPGIVTMQRSMFWDITLHNLPWKYHIAESISNGELPLWLPWMNYGFPQFGHYETWYPVSWFFGGLFGYNLSILQIEFLFHLYVAGIGFYLCSGLLKDLNWKVRLIGAISYMLCGVFIAQASHYGYIVAGAWMPFVFFFLIQFCRQQKFNHGLALIFFYFLLITGGYVGNFIVITYIMIGIFIYQLYLKRNNRQQLMKLLKYVVLLVPIFLAVYAVVLYSMLDIRKHITRQALEYSNTGWGAQVGTWIKEGFITFISPLANMQTENEFWGDAPMINDVYIGIFPVIFLLVYFIVGRSDQYYRQTIYLTLGSFLFFAIALSTLLPLHKWLYYSLPLLDHFRFPSLYRIFGMFLLLFASLRAIQYLTTTVSAKKRNWFLFGFIVLLWIITLPFLDSNLQFKKIFLGWDKAIDLLDQNALFLVDVIFITFLFAVLIGFKKVKKIGVVILVLVVADLTVHAWIRTPHYIAEAVPAAQTDIQFKKLSPGFPKDVPNKSPAQWSTEVATVDKSWFNAKAYAKHPLLDGASPYATKDFEKALNSGAIGWMNSQPFLCVFDEEPVRLDSANINKQLSKQVLIKSLNPNNFEFELSNVSNKWVLFNHNAYPRWQFYWNDKQLEKKKVDSNFLYAKIPDSNGQLRITFYAVDIKVLFLISAITFSILSLYLLIRFIKINIM